MQRGGEGGRGEGCVPVGREVSAIVGEIRREVRGGATCLGEEEGKTHAGLALSNARRGKTLLAPSSGA